MSSYLLAVGRRRRRPGPLDLVLVQLVRAAMHPNWSAALAVPIAVDAAGGDIQLLRSARRQVLKALSEQPTTVGGRVLETLTLALEQATPSSTTSQ